MKLVDLNLLLYAVNSDSHPHQKAKAWLEEVLAGEEPVAIPWVVLLGFLRISTNPRIFPQCLTVEMSLNVVDGWLAQPNVQLLSPQSGSLENTPVVAGRIGDCGKPRHRYPFGCPGHRKWRRTLFDGQRFLPLSKIALDQSTPLIIRVLAEADCIFSFLCYNSNILIYIKNLIFEIEIPSGGSGNLCF